MADGQNPQGGGAYDPQMMDYLVQQRFGVPMAPQGAGREGPDLSQQFQQQMQQPNAMLASLTGRAMSAPDALQRLVPGRAGGALSDAALAMSLFGGGKTIGENLQGVSGAMTELPYAKLMHAYQMLQPQLGGMQAQAGIQELLGRGQYYSGRNMSDIYAQQQRGAAAAEARAHQQEIMGGVGKNPTVMFKLAEKDSPDGGKLYKKNEPVAYYHTQTGGHVDPMTGQFVPTYTDSEPFNSQANLQQYGSTDIAGRTSGGASSHRGSLGQQDVDAYITMKRMTGDSRSEAELEHEAITNYNRTQAGARAQGAEPTKEETERQATVQSNDKAFGTELNKFAGNITDNTGKLRPSAARTELKRRQADIKNHPEVTPQMTASQFMPLWQNELLQTKAQIDQYANEYNQQPMTARKGLQAFLVSKGYDPVNRRFAAQGGPTTGSPKTYNPATGAIE